MSVGFAPSPTALTPSPSSAPGQRTNNQWLHQARNPVSLRLYKVLGTNFNDEATKEALRTLSDLYVTSTAHVPSGKEGKNGKKYEIVQDLNDEDDDEETTLKSAFSQEDDILAEVIPGESAARARRYLRRDMENKLAEGSRHFLKAFGDVDQKLDELQDNIRNMRRSCEDAEAQMQITDQASRSLLEKAGSLQEERQEIETRASILSLFLARFTLSDDEVEAMTSRDVPVGRRFFDVMDKTDRIRKDCRVLMAGEDGPTKAGSDIMASTSSQLEQGYEKIFRWCSYEFRQIGRHPQLEVDETMREAVRRLRKRPELLSEALSFLSQTRQATLLSNFLVALTRGGSSGLPRPIELHAHDPMRYVGDMLAWLHQVIAAEREFLEGLFGLTSDGRMVGSVRVQGTSEEEEWIRELMDLAIGKLCVPLKVRVQQTVRSQESSITSYKIANLLQFYMLTMRRTIGERALLTTTLEEITSIAYKVFYDAIETQGRALLRVHIDVDDFSTTPPLPILDHSQILREVMTVYQSSLLEDENNDEHIAGFQHILNLMVDPAIKVCTTVGEARKGMKQKWDPEVFVLNCFTYLKSVLEPFPFTVEKQQKIQGFIDERVKILTDQQYESLLVDAGLYDAVVAIDTHQCVEPLSRISATSAIELQSALHKFSLWLSGTEVVQSPRLSRLTMQRLHAQIHHSALEQLAQAYQRICGEVKKPENKYEAAATLLGSERPFGYYRKLISFPLMLCLNFMNSMSSEHGLIVQKPPQLFWLKAMDV